MKTLKTMLILSLGMLILCGCGKTAGNQISEEEPVLVGGWTDSGSAELTDELEDIFKSAVEGTEYEDYIALSLEGTQVVAGCNYKFLCTDGNGGAVYITVYEDLSGNCCVTDAEDA